MEGKDEETVVQSLHQLGYIPIRITSAQEKGSGFRSFPFLPQRVGIKNLLIFTQELSTLVSAGLSIDRSLEILGDLTENEQTERGRQRRIEKGRRGKFFGGGPWEVIPGSFRNFTSIWSRPGNQEVFWR